MTPQAINVRVAFGVFLSRHMRDICIRNFPDSTVRHRALSYRD
jgi:hypothetical protein